LTDFQRWQKSYPQGARWDAPIGAGAVQDVLERSAKRFGDLPALEFMGRRIGYAEVNALADRFAAGLQKLGVGPGVHVGLYLPNTPHYIIAFFGVLKAGGAIVNYSPLDAERVLEHKVEDSRTDILVTLDLAALYPQMERLLAKTRLKTLVVGELAEFTPAPDLVRAQMQKTNQLSAVEYGERIVAFRDLLDAGDRPVSHPVGDPAEAIAVLQYTGGTTGLPKGAMLTHANLTAANAQYLESLGAGARALRPGEEKMLAVLPPFHIYALSVNMLLGLALGAELVLHTRFDPGAVVKDIATKAITVFCGVPTMFVAVMSAPGVKREDLASLRVCSSGGAPLPVEVQRQFQALSGCRLCEGWGMTETSPTGTFTPADGPMKPGSCGIPLPGVEFQFADVSRPGAYVPLGEKGEILIRGPNVMKGYWNNPAATRESMNPDGFFHTGDVGYMDEDGFLYIVDRTKDMLLCGGFNVYPRTIEEAIYQHAAVEEVSVIGVPDAYRGQQPKAFVKLKAGAAPPTLDEMKAFLKDRIGKHEMIGAMEIRSELPKSPVGKILKKELYDLEARARASQTQA
jgi:long-chain acyl-CoA synthetase